MFSDATRAAFGFLGAFGFREVGAEATIVRYASGGVFLNVYHGRSSYELGVEVGLTDAPPDQVGYSVAELMGLVDKGGALLLRSWTATTPEGLQEGVRKLAEQVRTYGQRALTGDAAIFDALELQRRQWAKDFAAELNYGQISPRAQEAFRKGDYAKAVQLYERIEDRLAPVERKTLEYARKHLRGTR